MSTQTTIVCDKKRRKEATHVIHLERKRLFMKDLFQPELREDTIRRIRELRADSTRQWGNMTVAQTLAHCTSGLKMAMGVINPKRAPFPAMILGPLIKPLVFRDDKPMRRNSPSSPELFHADPLTSDLESERLQLIAAIDRFASQGPACCSRHPHPFFGQLRPQQWAILMYKHIDHHLRQFGV
jgi:hypothetical protein